MPIFAWIVLGLIAGFVGSKIVNKTSEGIVFDILLGIVGAVVVGVLSRAVGASSVSGPNIYSFIVAVIGSAVLLLIYHFVRRMA